MKFKAMIEIYVSLIKKGEKTLEDVPKIIRLDVKKEFEKNA